MSPFYPTHSSKVNPIYFLRIYSKDVYHVFIGKIHCVNYAIFNMADQGASTLFQAHMIE